MCTHACVCVCTCGMLHYTLTTHWFHLHSHSTHSDSCMHTYCTHKQAEKQGLKNTHTYTHGYLHPINIEKYIHANKLHTHVRIKCKQLHPRSLSAVVLCVSSSLTHSWQVQFSHHSVRQSSRNLHWTGLNWVAENVIILNLTEPPLHAPSAASAEWRIDRFFRYSKTLTTAVCLSLHSGDGRIKQEAPSNTLHHCKSVVSWKKPTVFKLIVQPSPFHRKTH